MNNYTLGNGSKWLFLIFLSSLPYCSTVSKFDQYAYTQVTSVKVDALNIMNRATEAYDTHKAEVTNVQTAIDKIYEYERSRPKNKFSEKMWVVLKDTSGHLFGGFIKRWQREGRLDAVFIKEAQNLVGQSFDQISALESGKIKPQQVTN